MKTKHKNITSAIALIVIAVLTVAVCCEAETIEEKGKRLKPYMTEQETQAFCSGLALNLAVRHGDARAIQFGKELARWDDAYSRTHQRNCSGTELCNRANAIYWRLNK